MPRYGRNPEVILNLHYRDATHLLDQWTHRLSTGRTFVCTEETLAQGTPLKLKLTFPGFRQPILLSGKALSPREEAGVRGIDVEILFANATEKEGVAALISRAASGDPELCARIVRVLVVEDNPHVAELIASGLHELGQREWGKRVFFEIECVTDGASALTVVKERRFDLILCDIYLPVMDGAKFIREIRTHQDPNLPVLALSAGGPAAREMAVAAGCTLFLEKPLRLSELCEALRKVLSIQ